eukprot:TRINITY_DN3516_c0_g1_i1.p1 TRINITY_DN3516_c0_g1~~TRINITY_DN3516_c0_g1_i1.p1  ORF type:complete len:464 (-),score=3.58 TRINITY_DN3516_c0_g1_i1:112-1503(-)
MPHAMEVVLCGSCCKKIDGEAYVRAFGKAWHNDCFTCGKCGVPIHDPKYAAENDIPYHGECSAILRGDVCSLCNSPITGTVTTALDRKWHPECFRCGYCQMPILTTQFSSRNNTPFHLHCQPPSTINPTSPIRSKDTSASANSAPNSSVDLCFKCHKVIKGGITTTALSKTWHRDCFTCSKCGKPIRENKFKTEGFMPYHLNCKLADEVRTCKGCGGDLEPREITDAMGELWHPECFKCRVCNLRIHGRDFIREGQWPVHVHCKTASIAALAEDGSLDPLKGTMENSSRVAVVNSANAMGSWSNNQPLRRSGTPPALTATDYEYHNALHSSTNPMHTTQLHAVPTHSANGSRSTTPVPSHHRSQSGGRSKSRHSHARDDSPPGNTGPPTLCHHCASPINGRVCHAMGFQFHAVCFTCALCGTQIGEGRFLHRGNVAMHMACVDGLSVATATITHKPVTRPSVH